MTDQKGKLTLEGELFVLVEEGDEEVTICAEIMGVNIWDWLEKNNGRRIKVHLETLE